MRTYFVCADIHSFYDEWMAALKAEGFDQSNPNHIIIMCGDLFDRGPDPIKCFEFAKKLAHNKRFIYIRGNHEDLLFDCYRRLVDEGGLTGSDGYHITNGTVDTIAKFCKYTKFDIIGHFFYDADIIEEMQEVLTFIRLNAVDYYEIDNKIFCHGWLPKGDDWRNASPDEWKAARWENGIAHWFTGDKKPNKTVYCGHWHCSYGWALKGIVDNEFPTSAADQEIAFQPFIQNGLVALDGCTVFSGKVNVIKFDN